jgi:hypothetical protein
MLVIFWTEQAQKNCDILTFKTIFEFNFLFPSSFFVLLHNFYTFTLYILLI